MIALSLFLLLSSSASSSYPIHAHITNSPPAALGCNLNIILCVVSKLRERQDGSLVTGGRRRRACRHYASSLDLCQDNAASEEECTTHCFHDQFFICTIFSPAGQLDNCENVVLEGSEC
jgi:hypothetical protein